jgi:hypothetical protein
MMWLPASAGSSRTRCRAGALTEAGIACLTETLPVHLQGVSKLFVERPDDQELAVLESALIKAIVDCTFG